MSTRQLSVLTRSTAIPSHGRRASVAGFIGSALEYYDMYIYASAATLVFTRVFFPDHGATGLLLSLATYGVAYVARPLGGVLAGWIGDRFGRRSIMMLTLLVMGIATFLIGCLPTFESVGLWAPAMLVALRILQGLSVGGEASGATSLTLEHAPHDQRGLYTSWMVNGIWVGYILATLAFLAVATLPEEALYSWGWRVPFWASAALVIVGVIVRRALVDPEAFVTEKAQGRIAKVPLGEVLRNQPWDVLRVVVAALLLVISSTVPVWGLAYAKNVVGLDPSVMLWAVVCGYATALVSQPLFAALSDRIGRKPVLIGGNLLGAVTVWQFFWAVGSADIPMIYVGIFLTITLSLGATNAVYPVFFSEMFNVRYRVTGMAVGLQLGLVLTGFSPSIIEAWSSANGSAWWPAALYTSLACVLSAIAVATSRETFRTPLHELGEGLTPHGGAVNG
ncbi:MFS transporter [Microbacterium stercoris]|uniref:MHS family MFS transporter n=1 Tax=Microbacterium stercoris TaxID=2820289 RepID=A0A939QLW6_9MICO|nr:MFS transporter [Microbacterium stercoris]MBO3664107.1 MHS family MFS transporter [Microbacterium stercoris]